jgi:hypothetical protein
MAHAMPDRAETREEAHVIGQTVRVTRGALEGLCGTVAAITAEERCVLNLHGVPPGVQIVIAGDALQSLVSYEESRSPGG